MPAPSCSGRATTLSRLLNGSVAVAATPVGLAGFPSLKGAPFRALYADGQDSRAGLSAEAEPEVPELDLVEQARLDAFAQGFDEGCRVTAEAKAADIAARDRLIAALEQLSPVDPGALSSLISAAVMRLVEQIVGEVPVDAELLRRRCAAVAASLDEADGHRTLRVYPDDVALLADVELAVPIVPDMQMRRGTVRLDTVDGWIEDGPDVRLSRLHAMLDEMEGRM
jgi:flagellar assembly protein FliH